MEDYGNVELETEQKRDVGSASTSVFRLFGRHKSIHQVMGGGKAADVILWKRWHVSCGVIVIATVMWLLFERSGLPFLTICSDVLLILIVFLYVRANHSVMRNKQSHELPELVLSEEIINSAAASFRVKVNNILLMTHDITLGKDFRLFFKDYTLFNYFEFPILDSILHGSMHYIPVVVCLWLFSVVASLFSFVTLAYIGTIVSTTLPALYSRYAEHVDRFAGLIHQSFSTKYKIVNEDVVRRLPQGLPKDKDE